jgi:hypothetical protein
VKVYGDISNLIGGQNQGKPAEMLGDRQYHKGVNITCRNGVVATRPGLTEVPMVGNDSAVSVIRNERFQGAIYYRTSFHQYVACAFGGAVFLIEPTSNSVYDITSNVLTDDDPIDVYESIRMDSDAERLYFCAAEGYCVVQDGTSTPLIIQDTVDGPSCRTAFNADEIPAGTVMAYGYGRISVKTAPREFEVGSIYKTATPEDIFDFGTETQYVAGGGAMTLPDDLGHIVGMKFAKTYGTGPGVGLLHVFCEMGRATYDLTGSRTDSWNSNQIRRIEAAEYGCTSHYSVVPFGQDLFFMTHQGLQTTSLASEEARSFHRATVLATEYLDGSIQDEIEYLPFVSACRYDNRLLFTFYGDEYEVRNASGAAATATCFKGIVSLDLSVKEGVESLGANLPMVFDGVWTGMRPLGLVSGVFDNEERCFVFGCPGGYNRIFELGRTDGKDGSISGEQDIECKLYSKSMSFVALDGEFPRPVPYYLKQLQEGNFWVHEYTGKPSIDLYVAHDLDNSFGLVASSMLPDAGTDRLGIANVYWPAFSSPCSPSTRIPVTKGHLFMAQLRWSGYVALNKVFFMAEGNMPKHGLTSEPGRPAPTAASWPDDFDYTIGGQ